jgi:hypothetical protein
MTHNTYNDHDDDDLESNAPGSLALPAVIEQAHVIFEHNHQHDASERDGHHSGDNARSEDNLQYEMHEDHAPLLPGQILTDTISRLRFTIVIVSFFYSSLFFVIGIMAVCLVAPNILYWMDHNSPILLNTARIIVSLIAIALACACIVIGLKQRELTGQLAFAEVMIDNIRDLALIQMQATRYNLEELTERLKFPQEPSHASAFDYIELARKIGPVISLLMAKERSIMTIAVEGLKLFQVLKKVLHK